MKLLIDKHATYQKLNESKLKLLTIPSIINGIQDSIKIKNKLFENYIIKKDISLKNEIHVTTNNITRSLNNKKVK